MLTSLVRRHQSQADSTIGRSLQLRLLPAAGGAGAGGSQDQGSAAIDALVAFSHGLERFVERRRGLGSIGDYLQRGRPGGLRGGPLAGAFGSSCRRCRTLHLPRREGPGVEGRGRRRLPGRLDPEGPQGPGAVRPVPASDADAVNRELAAISEDRRTFYVAASRGRDRVIFTAAPPNGGRSKPSRFLIELSGEAPARAILAGELPPLTHAELAAGLRRTGHPHHASGREGCRGGRSGGDPWYRPGGLVPPGQLDRRGGPAGRG